ncbi:hypothetical protein E2C00_13105 [Streptomyces sp. WAC05374]|uniref:DUF6932 family protein n=1 Tax=Streptomyces sp. WAC05374 TaxID=2487420 RepID=UPI000F88BC46|nr:hypothetical protein [Streptomyces sp. WAC05374]RST11812.1 hypothetical protein EF905_24120 [Streptomyces sp. WAC05374]TDF44684.1 hypothetical protein E2B92_14810 [Streptomyces sp. WAC05374]TDF56722.1 hypothetical protein E2C00_13105 [Streptomyces sp. WAC05374]TDF59902.1 hypothetical protein E2C02_04365 [Streptomyces sp. WAC05374]
MPTFAVNGFLPLGRHSVSLSDAESMLVSAPQFRDSPTRQTLWDGLIDYLDVFLTLEDTYASLLDGTPLIHRVWLGGSFVSTKLDPRNIDTTLLIDTDAERAVRGHPGSKWLTTAFQSRDRMREKYGVSPVRIGYRRVARVFEPERFIPEERTYFTERGVWDDWWQRCRLPDQEDRSPSERSAAPARGYLEVRL